MELYYKQNLYEVIAMKLNKTNSFRFFDQYSALEKSSQTTCTFIADSEVCSVELAIAINVCIFIYTDPPVKKSVRWFTTKYKNNKPKKQLTAR